MSKRINLEPEDESDISVPLEAVIDLVEAEDREAIYRWAIDRVTSATSADLVEIAVASGDVLVPIASSGEGGTGRSHAVPIASSIPGSVITSGESCLIEDRLDTRGAIDTASDPQTGIDPQYRSLLCSPIPQIGVVIARARAPGEFDDEELTLLTQIARIVGTQVDRIDGIAAERDDPLLEEIGNMVSHDLRNKINIATGRLDLARETEDETHLERSVEALESVERIADVVVSLARTGDPLGELRTVDLEEAVVSAFQPLAVDDAELTVKASASILADPDCLSQLLENLFRNAIDHSDGPVAIEVGLLEDGFYIADDGPGIPEDVREEVLELGFSTQEGHQGKGLSIVARMAQAHGWSIDLAESVSGGTRVEVADVVFRGARR